MPRKTRRALCGCSLQAPRTQKPKNPIHHPWRTDQVGPIGPMGSCMETHGTFSSTGPGSDWPGRVCLAGCSRCTQLCGITLLGSEPGSTRRKMLVWIICKETGWTCQCRAKANHQNPPGGYLNLLLTVVNLFLTCACPKARGAMAQVSLVHPLAQMHWISQGNRGRANGGAYWSRGLDVLESGGK